MKYNKIAVMGAGAMGTLLGACLNKAGQPVDLVDANREHVDALNRFGATVTGKLSFNVPVRAYLPGEMPGTYDLVFLLIKQTYNAAVFEQLRPHLHDQSMVVTLQNGFPERAVAEAFGMERTMGCAVTWAATFAGPGKTEATSDLSRCSSSLGRPDGAITPEGLEIQKILSLMCAAELVPDLPGIRWSKLLINSSFSGMSAALGCTFGQVLENEAALRLAQHIARECIRTVRAQGLKMKPLAHGEDLEALMDFETEEQRRGTSAIYAKLFSASADGKASMLQDLEHGRPTEIDAINGVLSAAGGQYGVPTPVCDRVVAIVKGIEAGRYTPRMENLALFD